MGLYHKYNMVRIFDFVSTMTCYITAQVSAIMGFISTIVVAKSHISVRVHVDC